MANITTPRVTEGKVYEGARKHTGMTVAAAELFHGTLIGLDATGKAANPAAGVRPLGRACCPDGHSSKPGEQIDIEEGSFSWDLLAGAVLPAIGEPVYAASNHEVSDDNAEGEFLGVYEGTIDGKPFFKSGFGVFSATGVNT